MSDYGMPAQEGTPHRDSPQSGPSYFAKLVRVSGLAIGDQSPAGVERASDAVSEPMDIAEIHDVQEVAVAPSPPVQPSLLMQEAAQAPAPRSRQDPRATIPPPLRPTDEHPAAIARTPPLPSSPIETRIEPPPASAPSAPLLHPIVQAAIHWVTVPERERRAPGTAVESPPPPQQSHAAAIAPREAEETPAATIEQRTVTERFVERQTLRDERKRELVRAVEYVQAPPEQIQREHARPGAERPTAVSMRAAAQQRREEVLQVSIGAISVKVDAPAAPQLTTRAPEPIRPAPLAPRPAATSWLRRRGLRP